jgi:hypothetical protein
MAAVPGTSPRNPLSPDGFDRTGYVDRVLSMLGGDGDDSPALRVRDVCGPLRLGDSSEACTCAMTAAQAPCT